MTGSVIAHVLTTLRLAGYFPELHEQHLKLIQQIKRGIKFTLHHTNRFRVACICSFLRHTRWLEKHYVDLCSHLPQPPVKRCVISLPFSFRCMKFHFFRTFAYTQRDRLRQYINKFCYCCLFVTYFSIFDCNLFIYNRIIFCIC